jgi:oligopeptide transport system ATP-binding protein
MPELLQIRNLKTRFYTSEGVVKAVNGISYSVDEGEKLAIVGESGSGKSVSMLSVMQMIPEPPGRIEEGEIIFKNQDLLKLSKKQMRKVNGPEIAMVFQDPMTSLNPTMRIGEQIAETLVVHRGMSKQGALQEAIRLLERTRIPEAAQRVRQYPFEFSGGMLQRVMIAISLACTPKLLIADEPTTALDVTIQDQVLELMKELQREDEMALVLITHDLGVVARMADRVAVMYAGEVVESGTVDDIFYRASHPYTQGLKQAMPSMHQQGTDQLRAIPGSPPDLFAPPPGCAYHPRCPQAMQLCSRVAPARTTFAAGHAASCWLQHPDSPVQPPIDTGETG